MQKNLLNQAMQHGWCRFLRKEEVPVVE